jgi:LysM repeat protein
MKFSTTASTLCSLASIFFFAGAVNAAVLKRQNGPVEPDTDPDCNYYDTAYSESDDCVYFEDYWGITHDQFVDWNPSVKDDCSGIKVGNSYCVEVARKPPTSTSASASEVPSATGSPKPSPTQEGLIESCTTFHKGEKGDTCDKIVNKYKTFTFEEFLAWNPAVGEDCAGLWLNTWYCIGIPGTPTSAPSVPSATGNPKPSPTQDGLIGSCTTFHKAVSGDTCDKIVNKYKTFTLAEFYKWNPAVGDDCSGLWLNTYYCIGISGTPTAPPPTSTTTGVPKPSPTQDGLINTCSKFYKAVSGDTCQKIVDRERTFSLADFIKWNPAVGSDCSGLWLNTYYCIGIPGTPTASTSKVPSSTSPGNGIKTPTPTQPGMVSNCDDFHLVKSGDNCEKIANANGITVAQFIKWNTEVGGASCSGLWLNVNVCISIIGHNPSPSQPPPATGCQVSHPEPTRPGSICQCKRWYKPTDKEFCADIQKKFGITAAQFNKWNPEVGSGCGGLWKGYYVCVQA